MAAAGRRPRSTNQSIPSARSEALAALQLWQTFEYLSPQNPPKPELDKDTCVWALDPLAQGDEEMPWVDAAKAGALRKLFKRKHRFMLFAGVIDGEELVETARALLDAPSLDFSEQRAPGNAASFVVPLDAHGRVSGEVFVSTVPWAIACMQAARADDGFFDFSGFFGDGGVQQRVKEAVHALLKQRQLIEDEAAQDAGAPAPAEAADGSAPPDGPPPQDDPFSDDADAACVPDGTRTLDAADVRAIADVVFEACGWRPSRGADWIVQTLRAPAKGQEKVADDPLNSFYAEELEKVQREYLADRCGGTLCRFLETPIDPERCDLDSTRQHLVDGVHPKLTPLACWPGAHPLVTAQQFAVNMVMRDLRAGGLFSVNGPPGTGKTTMLKDILAAVVQQRADALASFAHPHDAFPDRLTVERHDYPVWKLHDRLRGFGIVVACAGNGAAENISKDLPGLAAIDREANIDYFSEVANSIGLPKDARQRASRCWGLVSAALGKQDNRFAFATDFWDGRWDLRQRRQDAKESARPSGPSAAADPMRPLTLQDWVAEFGAGVPTWSDARARYAQARERAHAALQRAATLADRLRENARLAPQLQALRNRHAEHAAALSGLQQRLADAEAALAAAGEHLQRCKAVVSALGAPAQERANLQSAQDRLAAVRQQTPQEALDDLARRLARAEQACQRSDHALQAHARTKPGFLASLLFRREDRQDWDARHGVLLDELHARRRKQAALAQARDGVLRWQREFAQAQGKLEAAQARLKAALSAVQALGIDAASPLAAAVSQAGAAEDAFRERSAALLALRQEAAQAAGLAEASAAELGTQNGLFAANQAALAAAGLPDARRDAWHLLDAPREAFHRASPYHDEPEIFHARRELFAAALDLHKAFIVHSWKRLRTALYASVALLNGRLHPNQVHGGPMPLWDSLFLVVPLVSTTFASFPRLFRGVGKEQLAWVLIDEAGQAAPQCCVGALWRAQRAVVVGDPLQLEPVVGVPEELVSPLRERCGAAPRHVPPKASAQTLADLSNRYGIYLHAEDPDQRIWLGAPLIVHRRCINPMFEIANAIAYEGKMVYGAGADTPDGAVPWSRWLDAAADGNEGHWIPAQGNRALRAVLKLVGHDLRNEEGKLRVFVITPFTKVAQKMRELLATEFPWRDVAEMCGTVHTFQGKEADHVVFLLGGDPKKPGVISGFAGKNPNLVNVAVTRARKRLYVLGNRDHWTGRGDIHGHFRAMAQLLDAHHARMKARNQASGEPTARPAAPDGAADPGS